MNFDANLPEWNAAGIEPPQSTKEIGWKEGDKPPAQWHNWWMNTSYLAIKQLQQYALHKELLGVKIAELDEDGKVPQSQLDIDFSDMASKEEMQTELGKKVDKVTGKGLSTNDYTNIEKQKLSGIEPGANKYTHPSTHPADMITETSSKQFVSAAQKESWDATEKNANDYTDASHKYGGKFQWQYNAVTDSLDLVVIS